MAGGSLRSPGLVSMQSKSFPPSVRPSSPVQSRLRVLSIRMGVVLAEDGPNGEHQRTSRSGVKRTSKASQRELSSGGTSGGRDSKPRGSYGTGPDGKGRSGVEWAVSGDSLSLCTVAQSASSVPWALVGCSSRVVV